MPAFLRASPSSPIRFSPHGLMYGHTAATAFHVNRGADLFAPWTGGPSPGKRTKRIRLYHSEIERKLARTGSGKPVPRTGMWKWRYDQLQGNGQRNNSMTEGEKDKAKAVTAAGVGAGVGGAGGASIGGLELAAQGAATGLSAGVALGVGAAVGAALGYGVYRLLKKPKS